MIWREEGERGGVTGKLVGGSWFLISGLEIFQKRWSMTRKGYRKNRGKWGKVGGDPQRSWSKLETPCWFLNTRSQLVLQCHNNIVLITNVFQKILTLLNTLVLQDLLGRAFSQKAYFPNFSSIYTYNHKNIGQHTEIDVTIQKFLQVPFTKCQIRWLDCSTTEKCFSNFSLVSVYISLKLLQHNQFFMQKQLKPNTVLLAVIHPTVKTIA